jgi:hypothetical protein
MAEVQLHEMNVQRDRDRITRAAADATAKLAELTKTYHDAPENKLARDKEALERLRNDPHHLNRRLTSQMAQNEEAMLVARIADAEAKLESSRLDAALAGDKVHPAAGDNTYGQMVPRAALDTAVGILVESGVRPELIETFFKTGHGDDAAGREEEIRAAEEWERRLLADPEKQKKLLAKDPETLREFACYGIYRRDPRGG